MFFNALVHDELMEAKEKVEDVNKSITVYESFSEKNKIIF